MLRNFNARRLINIAEKSTLTLEIWSSLRHAIGDWVAQGESCQTNPADLTRLLPRKAMRLDLN